MDKYERAIEYARELGAQHGRKAASWLDIDESNAARILAGITDGDPAIMDILPSPDLSGQWADSLTGPELVSDAWDAAGVSRGTVKGDPTFDAAFSDICDAYEVAFSEHAQYATEDRCRYYLHDENTHTYGPVQYARLTGNPHRSCTECGAITLDLDD